jgi:cyclin B
MMKSCGTWTPTLEHYTGFKLDELKDCVIELNAMNSEPPKKNLMTVRNKYSHRVFHEVANIPPIDILALDFK